MIDGTAMNRWHHFSALIWWISLGLAALVWLLVPFGDREEIIGNSAFALLVSAVLVDVAVITSYWLPASRFAVIRAGWLVLAGICLIFALAISAQDVPSAQKDAGTFMTFAVLVLSFPLGLSGALVVSAFFQSMGQPGVISLVGIWMLFVALGYLQWFKLVPWVVRRIRERKQTIREKGNNS